MGSTRCSRSLLLGLPALLCAGAPGAARAEDRATAVSTVLRVEGDRVVISRDAGLAPGRRFLVRGRQYSEERGTLRLDQVGACEGSGVLAGVEVGDRAVPLDEAPPPPSVPECQAAPPPVPPPRLRPPPAPVPRSRRYIEGRALLISGCTLWTMLYGAPAATGIAVGEWRLAVPFIGPVLFATSGGVSDARLTFAMVSAGLLQLGGAIEIVTGAVLLAQDRPRARQVRLLPGPGLAGASLAGSF